MQAALPHGIAVLNHCVRKINDHGLVQEALQMHGDHTICHKYELSHLKSLAIEE